MTDHKKTLLRWIDEERDELIGLFSAFIRARSPNPPGDTREAVGFICRTLDERKLPYRLIAPQPEMANVVGTFECGGPGRHLVLNGHIDVYPVGDETWSHDPWGGEVVDGRVYGRGSCDMKAGTMASILTYWYIHRLREHLRGRLTLTAVSDEETMGPWGARYLMENHPEVHGDCLLNGEPSSPFSLRFGEKGLLWLAFAVATPGAHGAYTHMSPSATKIAAKLIEELEAVTHVQPSPPPVVAGALADVEAATERAQGPGAYRTMQAVTLNIGTIQGGLKVNMTPGVCCFEADIRLPVGLTKEPIMAIIDGILERYPEASVEEINYMPPSFCDPSGEMVRIIQVNVKELRGYEPAPILSIGGTDARLWRYRGIPGYVYGVPPTNMASADEHVEVEEFLHIVRTHALSAFDYLSRDGDGGAA